MMPKIVVNKHTVLYMEVFCVELQGNCARAVLLFTDDIYFFSIVIILQHNREELKEFFDRCIRYEL